MRNEKTQKKHIIFLCCMKSIPTFFPPYSLSTRMATSTPETIFACMADAVRAGLNTYRKACAPISSFDIVDEKRDELKLTSIFHVRGALPCNDVGIFTHSIEDALRNCGAVATISFPSSSFYETNEAVITAYIPRDPQGILQTSAMFGQGNMLNKDQKRGICRRCFGLACKCACWSVGVGILAFFVAFLYIVFTREKSPVPFQFQKMN